MISNKIWKINKEINKLNKMIKKEEEYKLKLNIIIKNEERDLKNFINENN